jgi:hypothetical protein
METARISRMQGSMGHFALCNCLGLGHTKYKGVQRVYCNQFPTTQLNGSHPSQLDLVMILPPGIDNRASVVSPGTVWYAWVLLLFSPLLRQTQDPSPSIVHLCRRWKHDDTENAYYLYCIFYMYYSTIIIVTPGLSSITCATSFWAHTATACRVLAMDAGCGLSTRGHQDGPGIFNEWKGVSARNVTWRMVTCEHNASKSPCLGHAPVCSAWPVQIPLGSSSSASVR